MIVKIVMNSKPLAKKRVLLLPKAECDETRENTEIIFNELDLASLTEDFQIVCDLSLCSQILGIQSCSSLYACPYCDGSKIDSVTFKPTNGRGRWMEGPLRTEDSIDANNSEWVLKTNSNRKLLKEYKNCEFKPMRLRRDNGEKAVLLSLPPEQWKLVIAL